MRTTAIRSTLLALVVLLTLATPAAARAAASPTTSSDSGVLVRVQGDAVIPVGDNLATAVVIDGDVDVAGDVTTLVIINGTATLTEATAATVFAVNGTVDLGSGATITGDVQLVNSDLIQDPTATVSGEIRTDTNQLWSGFWVISLLFVVGWAVLTILAALTLAAVAPTLARRTGRTITAEPAKVILAGLILWVVAPILSVILFATIIGVPTALTLWFVVLPALAFVGLLVSAIRIGEYLRPGDGDGGHPYLAAVIGTILLIAAGVVPIVGPLIVTAAALAGSGALVVQAWRAVRGDDEDSLSSPPLAADVTG